MKIKIWGARGSIPTPISTKELRQKMIAVVEGAKGVDLDDPLAVRAYLDGLHALVAETAGGDTSCLEIQADDHIIILDAGTGIRPLGQELMAGPCGQGEGVIHLFFSHTHWDHIQGFPFFLPAYVPGNRIYIYGVHPVEASLADQMKWATFPVALDELQAGIEFISLSERQSLTLGNIHISNMRLSHPGDAYAYRFEYQGNIFVYSTDVECKNVDNESLQPFVNFFANADALIFDSQFTLRESLVKADWGHSSALIGAEIARRAQVKRLILFHHDPTTTDVELIKILEETRLYQAKYEDEPSTEIIAGRESLTLDLIPPESFSFSPLSSSKTAILMITEDFDQQAAGEVVAQLSAQARPSLPKLIVDLSQVKQLYIAGLRSLIDLRAVWKGQSMALASVSSQAQEIIELTNCLDLFAIYPSVQAAHDALEAQQTLRLPGQLVKGRYRIEAKIRENDIGTVFKATDTRLDRLVSLMVLSPTLSQTTTRRLLHQAQKSAHLHSPHIVTLFDADEDRGLVFLVMEYTEMQTLRALIGEGTPPPLLQTASGITAALEYAHSKETFHGNLRPGNILIGETVKLTDFGLRLLEDGRQLVDNPIFINPSLYLAPEQIEGHPIDARTDLYALGVILYQLSTGQQPFEGNEIDILEQHLSQAPVPPRQLNPKLSLSFEKLILTLLAKDPAQRYSSATEVQRLLLDLDKDATSFAEDVARQEPAIRQPDRPAEAVTPARPGPGLIPKPQVKLIGRDKEVEQIMKLWALAKDGRGQTLLIGGEAGIGKTRLTAEIEKKIDEGVALWGRCSEFEGNPPYQPFVEVGRNYLAQTSAEEIRRNLGTSPAASNFAAALAPLITDIYEVIPDLSPLPPLDPRQEESRLKSSLVHFIERTTAGRPWLIILDDLHWSDPSSLQLLHYLARNAANLPLLIVGAYRDVELDLDHPLRKLMGALSRLPTYHQITLPRLSKMQVGQLLAGIWRQEVPDEWVRSIYERAGGNPFYIEEVAKTLADEGLITFQDGVWHFAQLVELKLPQKIRDIVLRRIEQVSPETQDILRQAAVLGQQFSFADLLAISGQSEDQLLASLDEAMAHYLIGEVETAAALCFSNIEIQQVIYDDLSKLRRIRLHQRTGKTLEEFYRDDLAPVAGRLAYHFIQADDREHAFIYTLKAGQHAQSLYAYETALRWYTQAAELLPKKGPYTPAHVALYQGLGDMLQTQTRFAEATEAYKTMTQAAKAVDDAVAQVQALYSLSSTQNTQGEYGTALKTARQTEKAARAAKVPTILARSLYEQGWALLNLGDTEGALAVGEQVLTFSSTIDATYEMGQSLNLLAAVYGALGNYQKASDYQQQALALYRELEDRNRMAVMLNNLGESYYLQGAYESAIALYQEALGIAQEIGDRANEIYFLSNLGGARVQLGDYLSAEADLLAVIQMPETIRSANLANAYRFLAEARLGQSKITQALTDAQLALALAKENKIPETVGLAWRTLGQVIARQPNPTAIDDRIYTPADCFTESLRIFSKINRAGERVHTLQVWAAYEQDHDNTAIAERLQQQAQEILGALNEAKSKI